MLTEDEEERAAIYEYDAYDVVRNRAHAELLVLKERMQKLVDKGKNALALSNVSPKINHTKA